MKIFIYRILDKQIYFFTDYGEGRGIWKEDTEPFQKEYFVEFDISKLYSYKEERKASTFWLLLFKLDFTGHRLTLGIAYFPFLLG